jgi:tetratricopeptide (TPR) repeat protein
MNNTFTKLLFVGIFIAFSGVGCNSSKSYYNKGSQLQQAGLTDEATDFFLMALRKNANNVSARIALKAEGQKLLETKLQDFYKLYTAEDFIGATKKYRECESYVKLVEPYVKLEMPPYYADYYNESKKVFLEDRYSKASNLINENKFESASTFLEEIVEIDPTYKDAASLMKYSTVEPVYMDAVQAFEGGSYRKAYDLFSRVVKMNPNFKETRYYQQESLNKGMLTIAIVGIESESKNLATQLTRSILQNGSAKKDPFLVYIDRENTDDILREQKLGLSGVIDESTAAETGKLLGARYLIEGKVLDYKHTFTPLKKRTEQGYYETIVRKYNKIQGYYYNQRQYSKTTYQVSSIKREIECRIELSLISAETGAIVVSQIYTPKQVDLVEFGTYAKDAKSLYPGSYKSMKYNSPEDKVNKDVVAKQKLNRIMTEKRRNVKAENNLLNDLAQEISKNWVLQIKKYSKTKE